MARSERRQRTAFVGFRLLPEEHAALIKAAAEREVSVGALIRSALRTDEVLPS